MPTARLDSRRPLELPRRQGSGIARKRPALALLGAGLLALLPTLITPQTAHAQYVNYGPMEVYPTTIFREGPGIKVLGDGLVLHPGIAAELGYDSNPLMRSQSIGAGVLRLRAHIDLATLPPQRLDIESRPLLQFRFGAAIEYRQFFSTNPLVGTIQQINASSDAELRIKQGDPLSGRIYNQFLVTSDARNLELATRETFAPRIYDRIGALGVFRPGNGPLEVGLSESFRVDYYVQSDLERNRSLGNDLALFGQLRVLPETLVKLEVRSSYVDYYAQTSAVPRSVPLRITAGVSSVFHPIIAASLYLGYGNSLHYGVPAMPMLVGDTTNVRYSNFVGGLEVRLRILDKMRLSAGYARDFFDSLFASYLVDDHLYVHYDHTLWRSLAVHADFDTYLRGYGTLVAPSVLYYRAYRNGATTRRDTLVSLTAAATFRPLTWLEVGASYSVLDDITDFGFIDGAGTPIDAGFVKHVLLFRADVAY